MGVTDEITFDDFEVITPSDTLLQTAKMRAIYVGVAGDITVKNQSGQTVLFKAVPVGTLRITAPYVMSTGTAATNLVALKQV